MKQLFFFLIVFLLPQLLHSQVVAKSSFSHPEKLCNGDKHYLISHKHNRQDIPTPTLSETQILSLLNNIPYLEDRSKISFKGEIVATITCEGKLVLCSVKAPLRNKQLKTEICNVFYRVDNWNPGQVCGKNVDCTIEIPFKVKKGEFIWLLEKE